MTNALESLTDIDGACADAAAAFVEGDHDGAEASYLELAHVYDESGFDAGLLVIAFNRLLVALDADQRARADALMRELGDRLVGESRRSPALARDIALRLCQLFAEPVPGIRADTTAGLVALASDLLGSSPFRVSVPVAELAVLPSVEAIAQLASEDGLTVVTALAQGTWGRPSLPSWLRAVQRAFGPPQPLPTAVTGLLATFAAAEGERDTLRGYPALAQAFALTADLDAATAAELQLGLRRLEARGLPERLEFLPGLPRERRLFAAVRLHGRLAEAVESHADCERLASVHWSAVRRLSDAWTRLVGARRKRGGGRADDVASRAEVAVWSARARRFGGDLEAARVALAEGAGRARRGGIEAPGLAAAVLLEAAELAERAGAADEAVAFARQALAVALPELGTEGLAIRAARVAATSLAAGLEPDLALLAAESLALVARVESDLKSIDVARAIVGIAAPIAGPEGAARCTLMVELTAARLGRGDGAGAMAAALAADDPEGYALARFLRAERRWNGAAEGEREAALAGLMDAAGAARRCARGLVRRTVEAAVADAVMRHPTVAGATPLSVQMRRAASAVDAASLADHASAFACLCPAAASEAEIVARLVRDGQHGLARRVAAAGRRVGWLGHVVAGASALAQSVRSAAERRFERRWVTGSPETEPAIPGALVDAPATGWWAPFTAETDAVRLEYRVYETHSVAFMVEPDGLHVRHLDVTSEQLSSWVEAAAADPEDPAAAALFAALLNPFERRLQTIRMLQIAPDGPLVGCPFARLPTPVGPLAICLDVGIVLPAPTPAFDASAPVARPQLCVAGDAATAADLQLGAALGEALPVCFRSGEELGPYALEEAFDDARFVQLVGPASAAGVALVDDMPPIGPGPLATALAHAGAVCVCVAQAGDTEALVRALAAGVRGGVVWRRRAGDTQSFLARFYRAAAQAETPHDIIAAFGIAQREAFRAGDSDWADFAVAIAGR